MPTITFESEEEAQEAALWSRPPRRFVNVVDNIVDQGRWVTYHELVVRDTETGKYYVIEYSEGSTEMQEADGEFPTEWTEVEPHEVTAIEYRPVSAS